MSVSEWSKAIKKYPKLADENGRKYFSKIGLCYFVAGISKNVQKKNKGKKKFGRAKRVWANNVQKSKISKFSKFFARSDPNL